MDHLWATLSKIQIRLPFLADFFRTFPQGEAYLVGGAIRDLLWGGESKDYDFLIRGVPAEELGRFLSQRGKLGREKFWCL